MSEPSQVSGSATGKTLALITLTIASLVALLTFCLPMTWGNATWGAWLFAASATVYPVALIAIGAERHGRLGRQRIPIVLLLAVLTMVMVGLFSYRGQGLEGPWWAGLPAAAAIQIYGLFLLPLLVTTLGYALSFDRWGLRQEDLDALRSRFPRNPEADPRQPAGAKSET